MISTEEILKGCKAKEQKAFEMLYKKYYRILLGIALRYSRNTAEAEDILQDSFIKIFNSIDSFNSKGSFEGWMKRIVQNTAINSYRSNLKFDLHVAITDHTEVSDDSLNSVFETFTNNEIISLFNQLPEGYRLVLNLFYIDGYSHPEISEMLNISIGTSKSQLFKAKNYLKNLLKIHHKQEAV
ncbi:MAG: sigma-70 family RNA polymerase sigma factor [Bacteroidetes bacterium]|nr:sigma-70 family RNA polymerase sigma factor [Bacteroidota bacterium]